MILLARLHIYRELISGGITECKRTLSPTKRTPIIIQLCLRSRRVVDNENDARSGTTNEKAPDERSGKNNMVAL